jgi:hypothetical protein
MSKVFRENCVYEEDGKKKDLIQFIETGLFYSFDLVLYCSF